MKKYSFFAKRDTSAALGDEEQRALLSDWALAGIMLMAFAGFQEATAYNRSLDAQRTLVAQVETTLPGQAFREWYVSKKEAQRLALLHAWAEMRNEREFVLSAKVLQHTLEEEKVSLATIKSGPYRDLCNGARLVFDFDKVDTFKELVIETLMCECCQTAAADLRLDGEKLVRRCGQALEMVSVSGAPSEDLAMRAPETLSDVADALGIVGEQGLTDIHDDNLVALADVVRSDLLKERRHLADLQMLVLLHDNRQAKRDLIHNRVAPRAKAASDLPQLRKELQLLSETYNEFQAALQGL